MSLYKNKYRIETTRLEVWDYSKYGYYFVTICTKDKRIYFGNAGDENILLNKVGEKVKEIWLEIRNQFTDVELDEFVIMPNHLHGIIFINRDSICRDSINRVSTKTPFIKNNPMYSELSLSKIIRWFKGRTTYEIHHTLQFPDFAWQPRYYEHIIHNEKSFQKIREYIHLNPLQWAVDEENPAGTKFRKLKDVQELPSNENNLIT